MIELTILGEPASKANSRRLVTFGNRPASIKSSKALSYEQSAILQIPEHAKKMLEGDLQVKIHIYYASRRPDLDESVILDCLQAKYKKGELIRRGVYINDRQIKRKLITWGLDKVNPRAEIIVEKINYGI